MNKTEYKDDIHTVLSVVFVSFIIYMIGITLIALQIWIIGTIFASFGIILSTAGVVTSIILKHRYEVANGQKEK